MARPECSLAPKSSWIYRLYVAVTQTDPTFPMPGPAFLRLPRNIIRHTHQLLFYTARNKRPKMSQYTINESANFSNNRNSFNVCNNYTVTDDRSQLLNWLSPLDPCLQHCDIQERRVNDVGEWFLETEEFRVWCGLGEQSEGDKTVLFCYGNPGVGKTFIR